MEETSNAMALDGIMFEGVSVRVRRPNDYNPSAAAALGPSVPNPNLNLSAIGLQAGGMSAVRALHFQLPLSDISSQVLSASNLCTEEGRGVAFRGDRGACGHGS